MLVRILISLLLITAISSCSDAAGIGEPFDFSKTSSAWKAHAKKLGTSNGSPIGINVSAPVDWSTSYPFVDIFRASRPFFSEGGSEVNLDRNGWPDGTGNSDTIVSTMFWDIPVEMLPKGDYVVRWQGEGTLEFGCAKVRKSGDHRAVIRIGDSDCGLYLKIKRMDEEDPVRDITITMPGGICSDDPYTRVDNESACDKGKFLSFEAHSREIIFNPDFLRFLKDFSVLRFMDAGGTNNSTISSWDERPTWDDATWQGRGFPVEVIVALGNVLHRDIWVTLPHKADDDFVRNYAEYVRDHLDPDLKVYVEYSNEVWNGIFKQNRYAREQGAARNLGKNIYHAGWRFYSERSVEVSRIWEAVFGGTDRLVRIMATQTADPWMSNLLLSHKDAWKHVDALAVAAYFGADFEGEHALSREGLTLDKLFEYLATENIPRLLEILKKNREVADKYDLPLVAYEGGQHLVGVGEDVNNPELTKLFQDANRDPRMATLYLQLYRGWKHIGGTLFVHYAAPSLASKWGSWGITEYLYAPRDEAPKYDATLRFIEETPRWW